MTPPPPIDLTAVLMTALLNPAVIVVAFWMGRYADQRHKIPVAAFAAALAGSVVIYIAVRLGMAGLGASRTRCSGRVHRPVPGGARVGLSGLPAVSEMTSARSLLRIWLWATVVVLAGLLVWAFAPVLVFFALLTLGIGLLSALMIALARSLQKSRDRE